MEELKPYNEASKAQRAERTNFDSRWSDLDFKNEQQLDEAIASIDYRLSHETNSVADEKKLIAELKKLGVRPSPNTNNLYFVQMPGAGSGLRVAGQQTPEVPTAPSVNLSSLQRRTRCSC